MGRKATKPFEERTFQGRRIAAALEELGMPQDKFLYSYETVQLERAKPSETRRELQERLDAANAEIARLKGISEPS